MAKKLFLIFYSTCLELLFLAPCISSMPPSISIPLLKIAFFQFKEGCCRDVTYRIIGVWRGVSKGVEDGRRASTLWAGHP
jgi:hypothetical protein